MERLLTDDENEYEEFDKDSDKDVSFNRFNRDEDRIYESIEQEIGDELDTYELEEFEDLVADELNDAPGG